MAGSLTSSGLISAAYFVDGIRLLYEGMTSFTPLGLIFTLLLSPVWLGINVLLRRLYRGSFRALLSMAIPTITIVGMALWLIWALNNAWMEGPDY